MARIYINSALEKTSDSFQIRQIDIPASISVKGLGAAEVVDLQMSQDDGATWFDAYDAGSKVTLTSDSNQVTVNGPGTFRIYKAATAGVVLVAVHSDRLGL